MTDMLTADELRDVRRRASLYMDYLDELESIQGMPFTEDPDERARWIVDYMTLDCYEWYDIMKGNRIEGFVMLPAFSFRQGARIGLFPHYLQVLN